MLVRNPKPRPLVPVCVRQRDRGKRLRAERGFSLIESLVAAMVLTVGVLASLQLLSVSDHSTASVRAREGAVTLAQQILEDARSIPYSQISSSTIASQLQAMPGLASTSSGSTWTITRTGVTYTITASVTTLNDPKDTTGAIDIKQIPVTVSWNTFQSQSHQITETATLTRAGQDPGLIASNLALASPSPVPGTAGTAGTSTAPVITSSSITSLQFSVTAPTGTTAIVWTLNGAKQSAWNGSAPSSGTTWTSSAWSLTGVSDGTYRVGAQAEDSNGIDGPAITISVRLIRNVPSAPSVTGYGFNANLLVGGSATSVAELQWSPNPELNVVGYRIYSPSGSMICQTSTTTSDASCGASAWCSSPSACIDLSPTGVNALNPANRTYTVKALYYDANNNLQEGTTTSVTLAQGTPSSPPTPASLTVTTQSDGSAILTWPVPSGGTPVSFYRIYRDGSNYTSRYDTLLASSCSSTCTYHDTARVDPHSYYVTAVGGTTPGADMGESAAVGPVSG